MARRDIGAQAFVSLSLMEAHARAITDPKNTHPVLSARLMAMYATEAAALLDGSEKGLARLRRSVEEGIDRAAQMDGGWSK